jgi:DNA-binding IclR family transcriptional regulator
MALPAPAEKDDKNRIQSYQRMMDVLQCFTSVSRRLTLAQIAAGTGLPRPTVHRILGALREIGFIEQDVRGGGYMLGIGLYELGSLSLANMDLHREAQPFVDQLARHSSASVHLGVFNGQSVVVIEREDFEEPRKSLASRVEIAPIHCTGVGKAVGAYLPLHLAHDHLAGCAGAGPGQGAQARLRPGQRRTAAVRALRGRAHPQRRRPRVRGHQRVWPA